MTLHVPIEQPLSDTHHAAIDDVNRWRGHCVELYARLEYEVTRTLSEMAACPNSSVSVPHNFGDKVKKLRAAVDADGPHPADNIVTALGTFTDHLERRNMLVHASGKVWIDPKKGDWLWHYRFQPSGKGRPQEIGSFDKDEALKIEGSLSSGSRSLGGQLRTLRQKLEAVTE
jgi:hypothetical protein